jgi:hypothetical protein
MTGALSGAAGGAGCATAAVTLQTARTRRMRRSKAGTFTGIGIRLLFTVDEPRGISLLAARFAHSALTHAREASTLLLRSVF